MNKKDFNLFDFEGEESKVSIDLDEVKYIFKKVNSGDDILIVVDKDNNVTNYDSCQSVRLSSIEEEFVMIYPNHINLHGKYYNPNEIENFVKIKGD